MKLKMIATLALFAGSFGLAACGDSNSTGTATAPATAKSAADMGAALKVEADKLLAELAQYIKDNKWDLADKAVVELDKMKPNLPPEYGPRIDQLKQALAAGKAAAAKMPAGLKVP